MAAGNVVAYMEAQLATYLQSINWASNTFDVHLLSAAYTPNYHSHSLFSTDASAHSLTTSGYAKRSLASVVMNRLSNSQVRFDADDITFSATATMMAKYAVLVHQTTGRPVGYVDLDTGAPSGIEATQIVIQWNSNGIVNVKHSG